MRQRELNQALLTAAAAGEFDEVKRCIALGADANVRNAHMMPALLTVIGNAATPAGHDCVKFMLESGAEVPPYLTVAQKECLNAKDGDAMVRYYQVLKNAVRARWVPKADVSAPRGMSPHVFFYRPITAVELFMAVVRNDNKAVASFLRTPYADVNFETAPGFSLLHVAILNGSIDVVQTLIDADADIEKLNAQSGRTPLHLAVINKQLGAVAALLAAGANPDVTDGEQTPLHEALLYFPQAVDVLLDAGANPNVTDEMGFTPLHLMAVSGEVDKVRKLLAANADLNAVDDEGKTPLDYAVSNGRGEVASLLKQAAAERAAAPTAAM